MSESIDNDFDEGEIESLELPEEGQSIEEKYKKGIFRVVYQSSTFFMPQLLNMLKSRDVFNIRPEYQRRLRWDNKQKSLLIESLLLNIPIPPLFFYETDMATYEVMDGQQRINAIQEFYNNTFKLTGLKVLKYLENIVYKDLHPVIKKGLDRASLSVNVLLLESEEKEKDPTKIRKYVFERLNTGGKSLNDQEVRNCIYSGPFNDLIVELSRERLFTDAWGIPSYDPQEGYESPSRKKNSLYKNMHDCQLVLRFFALKDNDNIRGSMKSILDRCMDSNKKASSETITELKSNFIQSMQACRKIFGKEPFKIKTSSGQKRNSAPLYDAIMVSLSRYDRDFDIIIENKKQIKKDLSNLLKTSDGYEILVGRGNTAQAIKDRINSMKNILVSNS